jgi:hypothetical protein
MRSVVVSMLPSLGDLSKSRTLYSLSVKQSLAPGKSGYQCLGCRGRLVGHNRDRPLALLGSCMAALWEVILGPLSLQFDGAQNDHQTGIIDYTVMTQSNNVG